MKYKQLIGMPHVCGDEPKQVAEVLIEDCVCPTYVGMNRTWLTAQRPLYRYAPRMWG